MPLAVRPGLRSTHQHPRTPSGECVSLTVERRIPPAPDRRRQVDALKVVSPLRRSQPRVRAVRRLLHHPPRQPGHSAPHARHAYRDRLALGRPQGPRVPGWLPATKLLRVDSKWFVTQGCSVGYTIRDDSNEWREGVRMAVIGSLWVPLRPGANRPAQRFVSQ
jgi:hypothetical protein